MVGQRPVAQPQVESYMKLTIAIAGLLALLAGRAEAQNAVQNIAQSMIQCVGTVFNSPEAAPLLVHVPFRIQEATQAQIADNAVPTLQEAAAVRNLYPRVQNCYSQAMAQLSIYVPTVANLLSHSYRDGEGDVALLGNRQMTWGAFNTRRRDRYLHYAAVVQNEVQRLVGQAQQQQQAAAAANFLTALAKLAIGVAVVGAASQPQVARPSITTCNTMGYQTTCIGY